MVIGLNEAPLNGAVLPETALGFRALNPVLVHLHFFIVY